MDSIDQSSEAVVIKPTHDIVASSVQTLKAELLPLTQQGAKHLILDLQEVGMIDSTGLSVIISTHNTLQKQGGSLEVINVSPDILKLFHIMRLDTHFVVKARETV